MISPYDKPDPPWQNGWDVLIDWEVDLMRRQQEREELLKSLQARAGSLTQHGGLAGLPGGFGGVSAPGTATAATTTSTGGA